MKKVKTVKTVKTVFVIGMLFLYANSFGQTTIAGSEKTTNDVKRVNTYFDLMVNVVSTNINYGNLNSVLADYKKSNNGIQAGASFQAGITPVFSLVTEFYYMRKGGKLKANNPLTSTESTLHLNTLELPVLARFHAGRFYANAGPAIAYNLSGNQKIDNESTKLSFKNSGEGFKRVEASVQAGGGYMFPWKNKRIAVDLRYNYGLTNLSNDKEMYNRGFIVSVHFSRAWKTNPFSKK